MDITKNFSIYTYWIDGELTIQFHQGEPDDIFNNLDDRAYDGLWVISDLDGNAGIYRTLERALWHLCEWCTVEKEREVAFEVEVQYDGTSTISGVDYQHLVLSVKECNCTQVFIVSNEQVR